MNCKKCNGDCIKNGFQTNGTQRYICKICTSSQQTIYKYNAYKKNSNESIVKLVVNSCGIRDISRILFISKTTVISRILKIAKNLQWPRLYEVNHAYEADELYIKLIGMKKCYLSYIMNKKTKQVISFCVGRRTIENMKPPIHSTLCLTPTTTSL